MAYAIKEAGYRHIDCAWCPSLQCRVLSIADPALICRAYGNEKEVGEGIRASGVPRSEIFVSSYRPIVCTFLGELTI